MIEYKVVGFQTLEHFEELVNEAISEGWVPQGGILAADVEGRAFGFYQAMVRNKDHDKPVEFFMPPMGPHL